MVTKRTIIGVLLISPLPLFYFYTVILEMFTSNDGNIVKTIAEIIVGLLLLAGIIIGWNLLTTTKGET